MPFLRFPSNYSVRGQINPPTTGRSKNSPRTIKSVSTVKKKNGGRTPPWWRPLFHCFCIEKAKPQREISCEQYFINWSAAMRRGGCYHQSNKTEDKGGERRRRNADVRGWDWKGHSRVFIHSPQSSAAVSEQQVTSKERTVSTATTWSVFQPREVCLDNGEEEEGLWENSLFQAISEICFSVHVKISKQLGNSGRNKIHPGLLRP